MKKPIRKIFELKSASLEENCIKGAAAVMGNLDQGLDVIYPGAFRKALSDFKKNGFVADSHDWSKMIAMPKVAEERGNQLYTEALFHGTDDAQTVRQKCQERMDNDLSIGLSIGFRTADDGEHYFKSGEDLLAHARGMGHDMSLFDTKGIMAHKGRCRGISEIKKLYEYSVVSAPMNTSAVADDVKGLQSKLYGYGYGGYGYYGNDDVDTVRADAIAAALSVLYYNDLCLDIYGCLYSPMSIDEIMAELSAEYEEFKADSLAVIEALLRALADEDDEAKSMFAAQVLAGMVTRSVPHAQKSVVGAEDLPLADRDRSWKASAAEKRVREWAEAEDKPNKKYASAFMVCDGDASKFGNYKLPFADVVDGKLTAIPRGLFAIAAVLQGSRGGVDLSDDDRSAVKGRVEKYYDRMAKEFDDDGLQVPWKDDDGGKSATGASAIAGAFSLTELPFEKHSEAMGAVVSEYTDRVAWVHQLRTKQGRRLSRESIERLKEIDGHMSQATEKIRHLIGETSDDGDADDAGKSANLNLEKERLLAQQYALEASVYEITLAAS